MQYHMIQNNFPEGKQFDSLCSATTSYSVDCTESLVHQVGTIVFILKESNVCCLGRHCCLFCNIDSKSMAVSRTMRGPYPERTLDTLKNDFDSFVRAGSNIKKAKLFNNVISPHFFNIPITQVHQQSYFGLPLLHCYCTSFTGCPTSLTH